MKITVNTKVDRSACTEGKFTNTNINKTNAKASAPLELVHTDLAGPNDPTAQDGHKFAISFTDHQNGTAETRGNKEVRSEVRSVEQRSRLWLMDVLNRTFASFNKSFTEGLV